MRVVASVGPLMPAGYRRGPRSDCCRNRNVHLNNRRWDRPDLDCEPQQTRGIRRNLQVDETAGAVTEVRGHDVVAVDGVNLVKPSEYSVGERSGSREMEAARGFETVPTIARFPSTICALCPHAGHRRSNVSMEMGGGCSLWRAPYAGPDIRGRQRWR